MCFQVLGTKNQIPTSVVCPVYCTKKCQTRIPKPPKPAKNVSNDEGKTTATEHVQWSDEEEMEVVINWITTKGNYSFYCGNSVHYA